MSQLVELEKRFESALEKLELALANSNPRIDSGSVEEKKEILEENDHNIDYLLSRIDQLEKAAKNDADEIDKLIRKLKEVFELKDD